MAEPRWVPVDTAVVLDALEMMVEQYLHTSQPNEFTHSFMSAGEYACEVLAERRPERWELTKIGVRRRG